MGKIFAGFALYSQKGLRKRKDSRLRGENSGGFANEKSWHGVGIESRLFPEAETTRPIKAKLFVEHP